MVSVVEVDRFSRIDKLFVDEHEMAPAESFAKRSACRVHVVCGPEVSVSRTAQAAVMTVLCAAQRCYPGGVTLQASEVVRATLSEWGSKMPYEHTASPAPARYVIVIGTADAGVDSIQVSFDGWTAQVGPGRDNRLAEHDHCPLAGILAGALAVSETFMHFAGIAVVATHRRVQMSLWQPGARSPEPGPRLAYLPSRAWLAGLGHLGQAYAWAFAWLPFGNRPPPELWLVDDEKVGESNLETGMLSIHPNLGEYKTRVVSSWLKGRGIQARMIERRMDARFGTAAGEPRLILGGFDSNPARHILANSGASLIDAGIGDRAENFDTFVVRAWPNPRTAGELWPRQASTREVADRLARDNRAYAALTNDSCGRVQLAECAVGVPFVGTAAAAFAWAQVLRDLHDGAHLTDLKVKLSSPEDIESFSRPSTTEDIKLIEYVDVIRTH